MNKKESPEKRAKKRAYIITTARRMFLEKGIEAVSMKEIAEECLYGVATLYRWFSAKKYIVVGVGVSVWEEQKVKFEEIAKKNEEEGLNGFESFRNLMNYYESIFKNTPKFYVFLDMFDNYVLKEKMTEEDLAPYNDVLMQIQKIISDCIQKGIADHTIRDDIDFTTTYYSFSKALIGLAQKLIMKNEIVSSDRQVSTTTEIHTLIHILMDFIENPDYKAKTAL